jgi:hypothetical protein
VIFNPREPYVNHKSDKSAEIERTNATTSGRAVEIVKEEGDDVELICGLTQNFGDIKWIKKDHDVIN